MPNDTNPTISTELTLLATLLNSRKAYEQARIALDAQDFSRLGYEVYSAIVEWYHRDRDAQAINRTILLNTLKERVPSASHSAFDEFARSIPSTPSSSLNLIQFILENKRAQAAQALTSALTAQNYAQANAHMTRLQKLTSAVDFTVFRRRSSLEDALSIDELFDEIAYENKIKLYPDVLNNRTDGGVFPGAHIILFGRPEIGKSTFNINLAVSFALKERKRVLYISNEDNINVIKARAVARACGLTHQEMHKDKRSAAAKYKQLEGEQYLRFMQATHASLVDLKPAIESFEAQVVVLDQIRNASASAGDNFTQRLEENGKEMRELLNEYGLIGVSITQAGMSAAGKTFLTMEDLDSSKTGLQGTADLMIGIGATLEVEARGQRGLSFPKNKLSTAMNSKEGVLVDFDLAHGLVK